MKISKKAEKELRINKDKSKIMKESWRKRKLKGGKK